LQNNRKTLENNAIIAEEEINIDDLLKTSNYIYLEE